MLDAGTWHLPDPDLAAQPFVLVPCADVAPDAVHPDTGATLAAMRDGLPAAALQTLARVDAP